MKILDIEQGTESWKELRKTKITATDIPKIMGLSPWDTARTLWLRKNNLMPEQEVTPAMLAGAEIESSVREMCKNRLGIEFYPVVGLHDDYDWAMASFDGINADGYVLEIKLANKYDHALATHGSIPDKYYPQVQWQLFVSGFDKAYYASYHKMTDDLVIVPVEKDYVAIDKYLLAAEEFRGLKEAPDSGQDDIITHDKDFEWSMLSDDLRDAEKAFKQAEADLKEVKAKMVGYLVKNEVDHVHKHKGDGVEMTYVTRKGSIKYDSIPEVQDILETIDLEKYRGKDSGYWKFSVKEDQ